MSGGQPAEIRRLWTRLWIVWKSTRREQLVEPAFTCPRCGMTSHNPGDAHEGYCGNCHDWTGERSDAQ